MSWDLTTIAKGRLPKSDLRVAFFHVVRGLLVGLLGFGLGVGAGLESFDGPAEAHGASAGYFCFERVKAACNVQVFCHVRCRDALAEVLEAIASRLRVVARQRFDLAGNGRVVAQDFAWRSVRHVGVRGGSARFMGATHAGAAIGSASRGRATAGMRALSEGWSAERQRHHCDDNQSRTFHVVPPMIGLEGTTDISSLSWRGVRL
jgi:hypothetical protein